MAEIAKVIDDQILRKIVKIIDNGGVVCFPTETVYALVADASNDAAIEKIYDIKGKHSIKPLSILISDIYQAKRIAHFNEKASKLALNFFPGPLTMVLKMKEHNNLSPLINRELGTIGIRIPSHRLSLKIIKAVGRPVVGTSASISNEISRALNAEHVINTIGTKVDLIIDQGHTELGIESTIIDLSQDNNFKILREGAIPKEKILEILHNK